MVEIEIGTNEEGQRLDRFLRKYLKGAPLSLIYKIIRKDAKVNLKREKNVYVLKDGDVIQLYLSPEEIEGFRGSEERKQVRRTFRIVYEDADVLIADKPAGLLTHGDKNEKSDHLTNQVQGYLIEKGDFVPSKEKTFAPSPVNRIDRNTTGLVIFAKNYSALKKLTGYIRDRKCIRKFYQTVVCGEIREEQELTGFIEKDEQKNVSRMTGGNDTDKSVVTRVRPLLAGYIKGLEGSLRNRIFTLVEVEIETGRTHQIRVQLADAGHPLIGDAKYGDRGINKAFFAKYGLGHQLLTAERLEISGVADDYPALEGKSFHAKLPKVFENIKRDLSDE